MGAGALIFVQVTSHMLSSTPPRATFALGLLALLMAALLAGCKDFPGADGRYASGFPTAGPGRWAP
jgi:hypothetical protein